MPTIEKYLKLVIEKSGSDVHLVAGLPPKLRIHGSLEALAEKPLEPEACQDMLFEILRRDQRQKFQERRDIDFAYEIPGVARFRANYFQQSRGVAAVFRLVPNQVLALNDLGLPPVIERFLAIRSGLLLVTGPTGSGKSTTLAALIDAINERENRHILTIEDPIEFVHKNKRSVITQREIGRDSDTFPDALRAAGRQDPDIVLVGEMRDRESIGLAVSLAEMGTLVLATLHTNNASKTIDRIIDVFPEEQQGQIRSMLATTLKGVCSQLLLRRADRKGRVPVNEILLGSIGLSNLVREGMTHKIPSLIESGRGEGMQLMDDSILQQLEGGRITPSEAYASALDKGRFERFLQPPSASGGPASRSRERE
ncbi:MAG: type IV pilus twitching motility protein PilT [Planctomycetes bacterium]|nr:type IV pilus twitching motility protein PilT [Planctomycetota bacterium]